ncbi:MAG: hypothetical protein HZC04_01785 [Candidatus Lloydbacteria bacterium]|nr:hypothetical protein [Candidatus Lloydbacteria bacterium]
MANLLLPESQEKIRQEYRLRRAVIIFFLLAAIIIFAGILLAPSLLLSSIKAKESEMRLALLRGGQTQNAEEQMQNIISRANANVELLEEDASPMPVIGGLTRYLLNTKPEDIAITGLLYEKAKNNALDKVSLRGIAASREALLSYVTFLETNGYFAEAVLPVSHFVQEKNILFTISLTIKPRDK